MGAENEVHAWQAAFLTGPMHGRLRWYVDGHLRFGDGSRNPWTQILRPALQLDLSSKVALYFGMAWVWGHTRAGVRLERRPWQQLFVHHDLGAFRLSHRLRVEERFLPDGGFAWRFRYFLRVAAPLRGRLWLGTIQEVFLRPERATFDQHRAFFGPSITWGTKGSRLDIGYQLLLLSLPDPPSRIGHTFLAAVFQNF
jgi:hypothetical protein